MNLLSVLACPAIESLPRSPMVANAHSRACSPQHRHLHAIARTRVMDTPSPSSYLFALGVYLYLSRPSCQHIFLQGCHAESGDHPRLPHGRASPAHTHATGTAWPPRPRRATATHRRYGCRPAHPALCHGQGISRVRDDHTGTPHSHAHNPLVSTQIPIADVLLCCLPGLCAACSSGWAWMRSPRAVSRGPSSTTACSRTTPRPWLQPPPDTRTVRQQPS